jgi:hypothetical protein
MAIRTRREGWKRKSAAIALAAILGSTVYGDNPGARGAAGTGGFGRAVGRVASEWFRTAEEAASIGILSGTVLSRMDPGVRRSILAAVEGVREVCTRRTKPKVSRCALPHPTKKPLRCARA